MINNWGGNNPVHFTLGWFSITNKIEATYARFVKVTVTLLKEIWI